MAWAFCGKNCASLRAHFGPRRDKHVLRVASAAAGDDEPPAGFQNASRAAQEGGMVCRTNAARRWKKSNRTRRRPANLIFRASMTWKSRFGKSSPRKVARAKPIISAEASIPTTEPRGTARAISAVILPSPQPTSRMCSSPRRLKRPMSSRAQVCCTAEFAA